MTHLQPSSGAHGVRLLRPRSSCCLLLAIGLAALLALPATAQITRGVDSSATQRGRITGSLVVGVTNEPIAGATVRVAGEAVSAVTGADGAFTLTGVPPGTHLITISSENIVPAKITDVVVRPGDTTSLEPLEIPIPRTDGSLLMQEVVVNASELGRGDTLRMAAVEVTETKVKPFSSANMDLPRTVNDPQAYYIFDSRNIERSGAPSIEQFIREWLPMSSTASSLDQSVFIGGTASSMNLRGIGAAQTLVLINGRQAPMADLQLNSQSPQPDINGIPLSAVDRIEVLPSSASGIYGGNAVGGVINIVLKRNFGGGEMKVNYQNTFDSDAPIVRYDLSYGFSLEGGRTQVMVSGSWGDRELLRYADRFGTLDRYESTVAANDRNSTSPTVPLGTTPNIRSANGSNLTLKPAYGGATLSSPITHIPEGTTPSTSPSALAAGLIANAGSYNTDRPQTVQVHGGLGGTLGTAPRATSLMANIRREFTPNLEIFGEFGYSGTSSWRDLNSNLTVGFGSIPANSPFNPFTQALTLVTPIAGDYPVSSNNRMNRATIGAILKLPHDWRVEAEYTWTTSHNTYRSTGFLSSPEISADLAAGEINPFVDTSLVPLNLDIYNSTIVFGGGSSKNLVSLRAVGPVFRLPAGQPQLSVGVEHRSDGLDGGYHVTTFANFPSRSIVRYAIGKSQVTNAGYAEVRLPVVSAAQEVPAVRLLELQLTARTDDYDIETFPSFVQLSNDAPTTLPSGIQRSTARYRSTNPTVAMRYQPVQGIMIRGSISRGFGAPTYNQLLGNPDESSFTSLVTDPRRGNATYGVHTLSGGNPNIQPEKSRSKSVGIVLTPSFLKGFRFSADWTRIDKENNIGTLTLQQMVDNESLLPGRVTRDPAPSGDPFGVGPITLVDLSMVNFLSSRVESVDYSLGYRHTTDSWGMFEFNVLATHTRTFQRQLTANQPPVEGVNFSAFGPLSRQGNARLTWDYRRWSAGWIARYVGGYRIMGPPVSSSTINIIRQGDQFVKSQVFHEVFVTHRFPRLDEKAPGWQRYLRGVELSVGVRNLFNSEPRFDASNVTYFYSTWGDIRMREYRLTLKKAF